MSLREAFLCCIFLSGLTHTADAQAPSCKYIHLKFKISKATNRVYVTPDIVPVPDDAYSHFMQAHSLRFEYLLLNAIDSIGAYRNFYPDKKRMNAHLCDVISTDKKFAEYVLLLSPPVTVPATAYTKDELMLVASRFFLCDKVNADTSVSLHICISLNGIKELEVQRDYKALAAFCYEAIFKTKDSAGTEDAAAYMSSLSTCIQDNTIKARKSFKNLPDYLSTVKNATYNSMQHDTALERTLLQYYNDNRNNLGFVIE